MVRSGSFFNEFLVGGQVFQVLVKVSDEVSHAQLVHDSNELRLEPGLHITGNMLDGGSDGVPSGERGVHDDAKVFDL